MKKTILTTTAIAVLALAAPAGAASGTKDGGKTSTGHKITPTVAKNGKIRKLVAGIGVTCLPIQGGGRNFTGAEVFGFKSTVVRVGRHDRFKFMGKPAFHYNEVTMNNDLWTKRRGSTITGRMRRQYSFLVPKYPIGTFSIYSCLGGAKFKARARG